MQLADFGSFHVGGKRVDVEGESTRTIWFTPDVSFDYDPNGAFHVEQAWVQFFLPLRTQSDAPLVLVHGGGLCGVTWDTTPDGRHGWLQHFVSMGHNTYVIDNVERGRAGFNAVVGHEWSDKPIIRSEREAWSLFRIGTPDDYDSRSPLPNCQFPHEAIATMTMQNVPRWTSTTSAACDALEAALESIVRRHGAANVVCHSQGGGIANTVASRRPELFNAVVAIEASGFPDTVTADAANIRWLSLLGDHMQINGTSVHLYEAAYAHHEKLRAVGAVSEVVETSDIDAPGNTHMMMMDKNNDRLAAFIHKWLTDETP